MVIELVALSAPATGRVLLSKSAYAAASKYATTGARKMGIVLCVWSGGASLMVTQHCYIIYYNNYP